PPIEAAKVSASHTWASLSPSSFEAAAAMPKVPTLAQESQPRSAAPPLEQVMPGRAATSKPMMIASSTSLPEAPRCSPSEKAPGIRQQVYWASGQATSSSSVQCEEVELSIAACSTAVVKPRPTAPTSPAAPVERT